MRIGVALPHGVHNGRSLLSWAELEDLAVRLETAGFDSLWVSDHYFLDLASIGVPATVGSQLDAMVLLPALAVATKRVRLGTMVLSVGFRPASVLAKAVSSLDRLSNGRFVLGLGLGSDEAQYESAGLRFPPAPERMEQLEEAVILIREMTSHPRATVAGRHFRIDDAPNLPQATQATVPILVEGHEPGTKKIAARVADIWSLSGSYSPATYAGEAAEFERACEETDRNPDTVQRSLGLVALVGEDEDDLARRFEDWRRLAPGLVKDASPAEYANQGLVGTPGRVRERVEEFRALGVTDLVLSFSPLMFGWSSSAGWDIVAEELLPVYREASR